MSSKLNVKQGKKDRPRSSDRLKGRRRDGTPDKSATPSQEAQDENRPPSRQVIWDEEIEKLQIKSDDLEKVRAPQPPSEPAPPTSTVTVRKMKSASELNKPRMKSILVAKPASPDAPLKSMDYSGYAGPRYDTLGRVIPHSILGSYEDYHREATQRGDLLDIPTPRIEDSFSDDKPTLKYEKKRKSLEQAPKKADENNALRNWQLRMLERKRQQGYISKLLQKEPQDLVMNQADTYRKTQEDRYLIDRTIPFVDYGKGYRVGSEFWKQQERFGDELSGVHMTLTQAERGYPPPVEHVGVPEVVRNEKGMEWSQSYTPSVHYPWQRSQYLQARRKQLQPIMDELTSHRPDFSGLQVIGTNDPRQREECTSEREESDIVGYPEHEAEHPPNADMDDPFHEYPDVKPAPVFGPSLQFAGQPARWTGDSNSMADQVGIEARVTFEAYTGNRITSYLEVINDGTTSVFYDWKKLPKENPFDLVQPEVQRFYFNNSSGVVLPGETLRFPFVFKSECAGVFTEQWLLETRPVLCGGAALVLTLRGVALQEDKFEEKREQLERDLDSKQSQQVVGQLMEEILSGIRTPKRARSPVDAYITEEEIFHRNNPGLFYRHDAVQEMKLLHQQLFPEEEQDTAVWDLCVLDLNDAIMELDEDDERKESLLGQMNSLAARLTFTPPAPSHQTLLNLCHKFLSEAVDSIVTQSMHIRHMMGLPIREMGDLLEDTGRVRSSDSRKGTRQAEKGGKPDAGKDKKPAAAAKDAKGGKAAKEPQKTDTKGKASTPSGPKKAGTPRALPGGAGVPEPRTSTPTSPPHSPVLLEQDQTLDRKYREKFYTQALLILGDKMERMDQVFQDVLQSDASRLNIRLT